MRPNTPSHPRAGPSFERRHFASIILTFTKTHSIRPVHSQPLLTLHAYPPRFATIFLLTMQAPQTSQDPPTASSSAPVPAAEPEDDSDDLDLPEVGDVPKSPDGVIEMDTLQQIREMDDEDEDEDGDEDSDPREFSRSIVWGFFDQAEKTFGEMQQAL